MVTYAALPEEGSSLWLVVEIKPNGSVGVLAENLPEGDARDVARRLSLGEGPMDVVTRQYHKPTSSEKWLRRAEDEEREEE